MNREKIMREWDYWRKRIAGGDKSSAPRDWFESIIDALTQQAVSPDAQSHADYEALDLTGAAYVCMGCGRRL